MTCGDRRQLIKHGLAAGLGALLIQHGSAEAGPIPSGQRSASKAFGIRVIDSQTRQGIPLVELRTTNDIRYYTDSAGWAAVNDPGLMHRHVYFNISSPGYEHARDEFGYAGFAAEVKPGMSIQVSMHRVNIAQRLYRVTGEGIYESSIVLGHSAPIAKPLINADVMGQDSVQAVVYRNQIHWFWGDTARMSYPLGNFRTSGAVSQLPGQGGLNPQIGVNLTYFTNSDGFCRPMCPLPHEPGGVVWIGGLAVMPDQRGRLRMLAHYSRRHGLGQVLEHGLAVWNDRTHVFDKHAVFPIQDHWRAPNGQSAPYAHHGVNYCLFCSPFPNVRVKALLEAAATPAAYEAFTCLQTGTHFAGAHTRIDRDAQGHAVWRWRRGTPPLSQAQELELINKGLMHPSEARLQMVNAATGTPVRIVSGSCHYNAYLRKWLLIGCQEGGTSFLGEIWCAAAEKPSGPWLRAVKIATHPHYSLYNPAQHPFFDEHNGKIIYFEGTYSVTFSGNTHPVPRYDYNQLLYRLDLSDDRLKPIRST
jgi:hypothetical protein